MTHPGVDIAAADIDGVGMTLHGLFTCVEFAELQWAKLVISEPARIERVPRSTLILVNQAAQGCETAIARALGSVSARLGASSRECGAFGRWIYPEHLLDLRASIQSVSGGSQGREHRLRAVGA